MIDLHCHCLPGIDDGPADLAGALQLCRALAADGARTVVATPHQLGRYPTRAAAIRAGVAALQEAVADAGLPLDLRPGADVRVDERLVELVRDGEVLTLADAGTHLLLELPHDALVDLARPIAGLAGLGVTAVVTHPERHPAVARRPDLVLPWVDAGAALQVTAGSLCGDFGPAARATAWRLVDAGLVAVLASDAHDAVRRPPRMAAAAALVEERYGGPAARAMCLDNPLAMIGGGALGL